MDDSFVVVSLKKLVNNLRFVSSFTPEEVDEAYLKLKGEGVEFITEPADYEWNAHCVYFIDSSGHMWELYCWTGAVPLGDLELKKNGEN